MVSSLVHLLAWLTESETDASEPFELPRLQKTPIDFGAEDRVLGGDGVCLRGCHRFCSSWLFVVAVRGSFVSVAPRQQLCVPKRDPSNAHDFLNHRLDVWI